MPMNKLLASFLVLAAVLSPMAHAQLMNSQPIDGIVAVVDEDIILRSELDRQVQAIARQYASNPERLPPQAELERQVLERMIMTKLQVARADGSGVKVSDAELDQTLQQIAQQNRMQVPQLRQAIEAQGSSWQQFRDNVHEEAVVRALRQRVVQSQVSVSDAEVDSLIKNGGGNRDQLHLGHIQITLPEGASAEQIASAEAKANEVSQQLASGMDFAAAAIRYSDAQNALDGGDLGWRGTDELPTAFAKIAENLQAGQASPPVRGPNGFHIIKLIEKRSGQSEIITEYHVRHILIRENEVISSAQAEQQVRALRQRIAAGEDFAKLAKEYSKDANTANIGGDMGWFTKGGYGAQVAKALDETPVGQISEPFHSDVGWHILEPLATRVEDKTAEAERNKARQTIGTRKAVEEYTSFLRQLRAEAYIEIRLPGSDRAGASG